MHPLPHGYTNDTRSDGTFVVKTYVGAGAAGRHDREQTMLERLRDVLPVASVIPDTPEAALDVTPDLTPDIGPTSARHLRISYLAGAHGQELIDAGLAGPVLRSCGAMLRRLQSIPLSLAHPDLGHVAGAVLVHGDYGPNNMLFDPGTFAVIGLLDWEWSHAGSPIEDLAWCEWIVRMHHPGHLGALRELFDAYGDRPAWSERRSAMIRRCQELLGMPRPRGDAGDMAADRWRQRIRVTESWSE
jgi:Phosphotransferase enzyme family